MAIHSDMQWPCPNGFHIPLHSEWQALYSYYTWLGLSWYTNWKNFFKIPLNWERAASSWNVTDRWSNGYYWAADANGSSARDLMFYSNTVQPSWYSSRAIWYWIRPFKDEPVVPDSSWVRLYAGDLPSSNNISRSSELWLITITYTSGGVTNRKTIADKNLWATTVWNDWDTLTADNCGKYYQWWNNYGFPFSWSITTSSTKVSATGYWPGNYYESSTFITSSNYWDTSVNNNLRWWVSQGTWEDVTPEYKSHWVISTWHMVSQWWGIYSPKG